MRRYLYRTFLLIVALCPLLWLDPKAMEDWSRDWDNS